MFQIDGYVIDADDYSVTYNYDGVDILEFDIDTHDKNYGLIKERALITEASNNYIIVKIDGNSSRYVHVTAEVDRRAFQAAFYENYENPNASATLSQTVNAFLPSGWTFVNNGNTTASRTLRLEHGVALDLLDNCAALWKVRFNFDTKNKVLRAVNPESYTLGAAFVTEQLNLRSLQYYGNASDFITRLEARGKDGLTFKNKQVHGQTITTSYVENTEYSDDIIYGFWQDERYTDVESLYDDAVAKLTELANPVRSYECDVIDLRAIDPEKYSAFDLRLYQKVSLKDIQRETATTYQVVKYKTYPHYPEKNVITLSTAPPSISQRLTDIEETAIEASSTAATATSWMTDSAGGRIYFIRDNDGNITSMVLKIGNNTNPPVWVFNANGIGYSATGIDGTPVVAMTADGNVKATNMETGVITGGDTVREKHVITTYTYDDNGQIIGETERIEYGDSQPQVQINLNDGTITMLNEETGEAVFKFDGETLYVGKAQMSEYIRAEKGFIAPYGWSYGFSPDNDLTTRNNNMRLAGSKKTVNGEEAHYLQLIEADCFYLLQRTNTDGYAHCYFKLDNESTLLIDKVYLLSTEGMQSLAAQLRPYL